MNRITFLTFNCYGTPFTTEALLLVTMPEIEPVGFSSLTLKVTLTVMAGGHGKFVAADPYLGIAVARLLISHSIHGRCLRWG